jgi:hypothetical protein
LNNDLTAGTLAGTTLFLDLEVASFLVVALGLVAMTGLHWFGKKDLPAAATICLLLGLVASVYGLITLFAPDGRPLQAVPLTVLVVWLAVCNGLPRYKTRIPGLSGPGSPDRYEGRPLDLFEYAHRSVETGSPEVHNREPARVDGGGGSERGVKPLPLLDSEEVLWRWLKSYRDRKGPGAPRPKLAVVATSGGASRAALWTAKMLATLEPMLDGFPHHVRLIAGASGGMVGAAAYAASLDAPRDPKISVVEMMRKSSISQIAQTLVLHDIPMYFWVTGMRRDRGCALDEALTEHTRAGPGAASLLGRCFRDLAAGETEGWRPSLVFSPMLIEDGRRLLISNLNLGFLTESSGCDLIDDENKKKHDPGYDVYSRSAVELFKLFPEVTALKTATAARLGASFPYISPTPSLPTVPQRRVIDAGYYDNYGVAVAGAWVDHHCDWLLDNTSGVVLIQFRGSLGEEKRRNLTFRGETWPSFLTKGFRGFFGPVDGALAARESVMAFRNDERVEMLSKSFNSDTRALRLYNQGPVEFFTSVVFEYGGHATMDWYLTEAEADDIEDEVNAKRNQDRLRNLESWWSRRLSDHKLPDMSSSLV